MGIGHKFCFTGTCNPDRQLMSTYLDELPIIYPYKTHSKPLITTLSAIFMKFHFIKENG